MLNHEIQGSGPVVLLLHAGVCDSRMWQPQWPAITSAYRAVRCDLRGYGETPLPAEDYADATDVLNLLDHLDVDRFALVGASYGGSVALQVASAVPARVDRLVLLSTAADVVEPTADLRAFAEEEDALLEAGDVDGATELNVRTWLGPSADAPIQDLVREMQRHAFTVQLAARDVESHDCDVDLARLTMPTWVFSGAHDLDFFGLTARHLAANVLDARHVELAWAGHLPSLERPDETTRLLLDALAG